MKQSVLACGVDREKIKSIFHHAVEITNPGLRQMLSPIESAIVRLDRDQALTCEHILQCHQLLGFVSTMLPYENAVLEKEYVWFTNFCAKNLFED
jgi:hypothetical protein